MTRPSLNILRPTTYQGGSVDLYPHIKPKLLGASGNLAGYRNLGKPARGIKGGWSPLI
jgi:hypothetical protein